MTQKTALVILHDGVEEMEAVAPIDILRRGGITVTTAAADSDTKVTGRSGIQLIADTTLAALGDKSHDLIVIPGGPGVAGLRKNASALATLRTHVQNTSVLAAICAAPLVLLDAGTLGAEGDAIPYTAHPSTLGELPQARAEQAVVIACRQRPASGANIRAQAKQTIITSRGAGTATLFALSVLEQLIGGEQGLKTAREVAESICLSAPQ